MNSSRSSSGVVAARPPAPRRRGRPAREWVGVAARMAGELYLVAREEAREVLRHPLAADARAGCETLGAGTGQHSRPAVPDHRSAPVPGRRSDTAHALDAHRGRQSSRRARRVWWSMRCSGFRRFKEAEFSAEVPTTIVPCGRYLAGSFRQDQEQLAGAEPAPAPRGPGLCGGLGLMNTDESGRYRNAFGN